jgi:hypothetical protein
MVFILYLNLKKFFKGLFKGFREAIIKFPPTHKFRIDTNFYVPSRMPSYTVFIFKGNFIFSIIIKEG